MAVVVLLFIALGALFFFKQLLTHDTIIINAVAAGEADITALDDKYLFILEDATILALNQPIALAVIVCAAIIAVLFVLGVAIWLREKVRLRA